MTDRQRGPVQRTMFLPKIHQKKAFSPTPENSRSAIALVIIEQLVIGHE
jgi:hypothetical protein